MYSQLKDVLAQLPAGASDRLALSRIGLERECLRVNPQGYIADTKHPYGLGAALTHPYITTDFSEALLEFITPPFADSDETMEFLEILHRYTYQHLKDELLWSASMPCMVKSDSSVPLADYGTSNVGHMKHVYRRGLSLRYGRVMQAIAGIHFNYSLPQEFWRALYPARTDWELRDLISDRYFGGVRNFLRYGWIVSYLFGSSPVICKSFLPQGAQGFESLDDGTLYLPFATSLRMSDIGYKNNAQDNLNIDYNSIDAYVDSLTRAIHTRHEPYAQLGVKTADDYQQLNANILQIENEFYSFMRPKQITRSGERPTLALARRGVSYIEMRALDINPFAPLGVFNQQLRFLEGLLLFCILQPSPRFNSGDVTRLNQNQSRVACCGRDPDLQLELNSTWATVKEHAQAIVDAMRPIMGLLDQSRGCRDYTEALQAQDVAINTPDGLVSAQIVKQLKQREIPFFRFAMDQAALHREYFLGQSLEPRQQQMLDREAEQSHNQQKTIEDADQSSFDDYLQRYFSQKLDSRTEL